MATPPLADAATPGAEHRRSQRVLLVIPLEIAWMSANGVRVLEHGETEIVNAHGGLLRMKAKLPRGAPVELSRPRTQEKVQARVVFLGQEGADGLWRAGVEFTAPNVTFWGVTLPPERDAKK